MELYYNFLVNLSSSGKSAEQCSLLTASVIFTLHCSYSSLRCNIVLTAAAQVEIEKKLIVNVQS